ncbi:MAG: hypothetical protein EI684_17125 [Candidatus Viridilinea halotolerans]|uniref:Uncharacterized protein n=1 Tax=Candidatus Viridilinea halotolerans TaxID=2491704 RepID=A0A426TUI4_9CHLR|nr:MAG: hypothetical protein EI684_17125 [Candidatus Viridilinea halotolerans]
MSNEIYIDLPAVRNIAKNLQAISEALNKIVKGIELAIATLKGVAFMGKVGGIAFVLFLEAIKPTFEKSAADCAQLSSDVNTSLDAYERNDQVGATRFY